MRISSGFHPGGPKVSKSAHLHILGTTDHLVR